MRWIGGSTLPTDPPVDFRALAAANPSAAALPLLAALAMREPRHIVLDAAPAGAVTAMVRAVIHTTGATTDNAWYTFDDFSFEAVPEPGTLAMCLMGIGFGAIVMHRRRRNG